MLLYRSGRDSEDFEQLVDKAYLVLDTRLTGKTMPSPDHPHHLESFDRSGGRLHRLKTSRGANDSLEGTMVCFNDVVQIFVRCDAWSSLTACPPVAADGWLSDRSRAGQW